MGEPSSPGEARRAHSSTPFPSLVAGGCLRGSAAPTEVARWLFGWPEPSRLSLVLRFSAVDFGAVEGSACSVTHDNQTGRYLPVFHAAWDPKHPNAFVVGAMTRQRVVEVFALGFGKKGKAGGEASCQRIATLGDGGVFLASVQSRHAFHPFLDVVACANSSGRVHIFD